MEIAVEVVPKTIDLLVIELVLYPLFIVLLFIQSADMCRGICKSCSNGI